jgi:hypothetical protein
MDIKINPNIVSVIGPLGERMTWESLPVSTTTRWVARRKAEVVAAVNGGLLTPAQACARYDLTLAELGEWQRSFAYEGVGGFRSQSVHVRRSKRSERRALFREEAVLKRE